MVKVVEICGESSISDKNKEFRGISIDLNIRRFKFSI